MSTKVYKGEENKSMEGRDVCSQIIAIGESVIKSPARHNAVNDPSLQCTLAGYLYCFR